MTAAGPPKQYRHHQTWSTAIARSASRIARSSGSAIAADLARSQLSAAAMSSPSGLQRPSPSLVRIRKIEVGQTVLPADRQALIGVTKRQLG